jgi:hypothetical protein
MAWILGFLVGLNFLLARISSATSHSKPPDRVPAFRSDPAPGS